LAAYDHCLNARSLFNLMDARGVISTTERAALMGGFAPWRAERLRPIWRRWRGGPQREVPGMKGAAKENESNCSFGSGLLGIPAGMLPKAEENSART